MGIMSVSHWLMLLAVVVVVFGTKKLKNAGGDIGLAIKDFRNTLSSETIEQNDGVEQAYIENDK